MKKVSIIPTAGLGISLLPATRAISKPLIPVYDKPLIYYAIGLAISLGSQEIVVMVEPNYYYSYQNILGLPLENKLGVPIKYVFQKGVREELRNLTHIFNLLSNSRICIIPPQDIHFTINHRWNNKEEAKSFIYTNRKEEISIVESPYFFPGEIVESIRSITSDCATVPGLLEYYESRGKLTQEQVEVTDYPLPIKISSPQDILKVSTILSTFTISQWFHYPEIAAYKTGAISKEELLYLISKLPVCPYRTRLELFLEYFK